jgi:chemotaxis protein MotA
MFVIIGFVVVVGSIMGGYLLEHGNLLVLMQPAELLIIGGAAIGSMLAANPVPVLKQMAGGIVSLLKGSPYTRAYYLENLRMLNGIFVYARKNGLAKLEADVEEPHKSQLFTKYPRFLKDHHAVAFMCDTLRMSISGGVTPLDLDGLMELDLDVQATGHHEPVSALQTTADALPGLGIVAAVLGVVITMGALGGPPEELGHKVAAALVGTFLGILLCYGFVGPMAAHVSKIGEAEGQYLQFLRQGILAFVKGSAPSLSIEYARRAIPTHVRPSFKEMETAIKGGGAAAPPAADKAA